MAANGHTENGAAEKRKAEDGEETNGTNGAKKEKVGVLNLVKIRTLKGRFIFWIHFYENNCS